MSTQIKKRPDASKLRRRKIEDKQKQTKNKKEREVQKRMTRLRFYFGGCQSLS